MEQNYERKMRQTLVRAVLFDIILASIKSVGSINTADEKKLNLVVHEELNKALAQ